MRKETSSRDSDTHRSFSVKGSVIHSRGWQEALLLHVPSSSGQWHRPLLIHRASSSAPLADHYCSTHCRRALPTKSMGRIGATWLPMRPMGREKEGGKCLRASPRNLPRRCEELRSGRVGLREKQPGRPCSYCSSD